MRALWRCGWVWLFLVIGACGEGGPIVPPPEEDNGVAPFVGTWDATVFDITSVADTTIVADLLLNNGSFTINVQESGTYTATLTFGGQPLVEIGQLTSSNGFVTLRPIQGDPATSAFVFVRPDYFTLDGPTEFDFNLDQVLEPAALYAELQRRGSSPTD